MRPIPVSLRERLANDPAMGKCLICGSPQVSFDHRVTGLGRRQLSEWWAIAPLCYDHHQGVKATKETEERARLWCLERGKEELKKFPKHNLEQELKYLRKKYEKDSEKKC